MIWMEWRDGGMDGMRFDAVRCGGIFLRGFL